MSQRDARNLLPGTIVSHDTDLTTKGTVLNVLGNGIGINWENNMVEVVRWRDVKHLSHWQPNASNERIRS